MLKDTIYNYINTKNQHYGNLSAAELHSNQVISKQQTHSEYVRDPFFLPYAHQWYSIPQMLTNPSQV